MLVIKHKKQMTEYRIQHSSEKIGLVPTMGALHQGHLNLINQIKPKVDKVIVSIFVNPSQFSEGEDLNIYPRPIENDLAVLKQAGVDVLFQPDESEMYLKDESFIHFDFGYLSHILCSKSRPNFISGVALVVTKLFNITRPDLAIFGQKDFQQFKVIEKLIQNLDFSIELLMAPIGRDSNNLALSSRNMYLSEADKIRACQIHQTLLQVKLKLEEQFKNKSDLKNTAQIKTKIKEIENFALNRLNILGFENDYFTILDFDDLHEVGPQTRKMIALVATHLKKVRLVDNMPIDLKLN